MLVLCIHVATNLNLQTIIYRRSIVNVIVATEIQSSKVLGSGDYYFFSRNFGFLFPFYGHLLRIKIIKLQFENKVSEQSACLWQLAPVVTQVMTVLIFLVTRAERSVTKSGQ